jgi:hypothetical protein
VRARRRPTGAGATTKSMHPPARAHGTRRRVGGGRARCRSGTRQDPPPNYEYVVDLVHIRNYRRFESERFEATLQRAGLSPARPQRYLAVCGPLGGIRQGALGCAGLTGWGAILPGSTRPIVPKRQMS